MHAQENLLTRDDTFFGICQGLGEDLGFNPQWLRIALAIGSFFDPLAVIALYAALGAVVAVARFTFPIPAAPAEPLALDQTAQVEPATEADPVPLAA